MQTLFVILLYGSLSFFIYLHIYLITYLIFIVYFELQFNTTSFTLLLKLLQCWPLQALSAGSHIPLYMIPSFWVFFFLFSISLLSVLQDALGLSCVFPPQP